VKTNSAINVVPGVDAQVVDDGPVADAASKVDLLPPPSVPKLKSDVEGNKLGDDPIMVAVTDDQNDSTGQDEDKGDQPAAGWWDDNGPWVVGTLAGAGILTGILTSQGSDNNSFAVQTSVSQ
jgi:hypothetical protein